MNEEQAKATADNLIIQSEAERRASGAKPNPRKTAVLKQLHAQDPEGFMKRMTQAAINAGSPKK